MQEDSKHEIEIYKKDILSIEPIYNKKFICMNCGKKIEMKVRKNLIRFIDYIVNMLFMLACIFFFEFHFLNMQIIIKYGSVLIISIGFMFTLRWISNYIIWLFRKRIKYVVIEEDE